MLEVVAGLGIRLHQPQQLLVMAVEFLLLLHRKVVVVMAARLALRQEQAVVAQLIQAVVAEGAELMPPEVEVQHNLAAQAAPVSSS